jgi:hypothetical protein
MTYEHVILGTHVELTHKQSLSFIMLEYAIEETWALICKRSQNTSDCSNIVV